MFEFSDVIARTSVKSFDFLPHLIKLGYVAGALFVWFVFAVFLRCAAKFISKLELGFIPAFAITLSTAVICAIFSLLVQYFLAKLFGIDGKEPIAYLLAVGFIIPCLCYARMIRHPKTGSVGIAHGILINCIVLLLCAAVWLLISLLIKGYFYLV